MKTVFLILYLIVAVLAVVLILAQGRGAGLGSAWGGGGETFSTRRGVEKMTFYATIGVIVLFLILSLVNYLI